jgi:DNA repair exonuclease SbcCD ATPase subunit
MASRKVSKPSKAAKRGPRSNAVTKRPKRAKNGRFARVKPETTTLSARNEVDTISDQPALPDEYTIPRPRWEKLVARAQTLRDTKLRLEKQVVKLEKGAEEDTEEKGELQGEINRLEEEAEEKAAEEEEEKEQLQEEINRLQAEEKEKEEIYELLGLLQERVRDQRGNIASLKATLEEEIDDVFQLNRKMEKLEKENQQLKAIALTQLVVYQQTRANDNAYWQGEVNKWFGVGLATQYHVH